MTKIIRGIWGDEFTVSRDRFAGHDRAAYLALKQEMKTLAGERQPVDVFYVYGHAQAELACTLKLPVIKLSDRPWLAPARSAEFRPQNGAAGIRYGTNGFWHKLQMLRRAVIDYGSALWLDLRVVACRDWSAWLRNLPTEYGFRAALIRQHSPNYGAWWRYDDQPQLAGVAQIPFTTTHDAARHLPGGGVIWCSSVKVLDLAIGVMEQYPSLSDQQCLAAALDQRHGRWIGHREYRRTYELPGYYYGRNRWYVSEADAIWQCGRRTDKAVHRHRLYR